MNLGKYFSKDKVYAEIFRAGFYSDFCQEKVDKLYSFKGFLTLIELQTAIKQRKNGSLDNEEFSSLVKIIVKKE